jgi:hypothetical protein
MQSKMWVFTRWMAGTADGMRIPLIFIVRCVSSALCYEQVTRWQESYQLWCLIVCDQETSERGGLDPTWAAVPQEECCTSDNFTFSLRFITEFLSPAHIVWY